MAKTIVYEGIGFNQDWIQGFKSEKEFIDAMNKVEADGSGYKHMFEGDAKRGDKLKELYKVATVKPEAIPSLAKGSSGQPGGLAQVGEAEVK